MPVVPRAVNVSHRNRASEFSRQTTLPTAKRFTPNHRLKTSAEFDRVFSQPWRSGSKYFTVLARANTLSYPRLGLIISKRCAKSAVKRNRLKRLIRESFRHQQYRLDGVDVVVIGKTAAALNNNNADLSHVLQRQWRDIEKCASSSS